MPRKDDTKEVDEIAKMFGIEGDRRFDFGDFLEESKRHGDRGSKNDRGDFTRPELQRKAREFLKLPDAD